MKEFVKRTLIVRNYKTGETTTFNDRIHTCNLASQGYDTFKDVEVDWDNSEIMEFSVETDGLKLSTGRLGILMTSKGGFEKDYDQMCEIIRQYKTGDSLTSQLIKSFFGSHQFCGAYTVDYIRDEAGEILKEKGVEIF